MTERDEREPGELAEWGRFDFRWIVRKAGYTMAQRGAWATVWCAVGLERRGGLISRETVDGLIGSRARDFLIARGDLETVDDRDLRMHGWSVYQAPLERARDQARERQRRRRERLAEAASRNVTERDESVTLSVSISTENRDVLPESTETTISELPPARAHEGPGEDVWTLAQLVEQLSGRPWTYSAGSRTLETLRLDVRDYGREAVEQALRSVPGPVRDGSKLVYAAHDLLVPFVDTKAAAAELERKRKEAEQAEADRKARAAAELEAERRRKLLEGDRAEAPEAWKALRGTIGSTAVRGPDRMRGDGPVPVQAGRAAPYGTDPGGAVDLPADRPLSGGLVNRPAVD